MKKWKVGSYHSFFLFLLLIPLFVSCSTPFNKQNQDTSLGKGEGPVANTSATATAVYNAKCNDVKNAPGKAGVVTVDINKNCPDTSQFAQGITLSDSSLDPNHGNDPTAMTNVQAMLQQSSSYVNTPIMGWGLPDPWPDPTTPGPTDWAALDARVQLAINTGKTPIITLAEAPWWMKGIYNGRNATHALTANEEWASVSYNARILDNKMGDWQKLVQAIAERYMKAPYNVRYFQVWNELKGYFDSDINNYDFTTSPGQPNGPNARHGYTYMYNQTYQTLMNVAQSQHIDQQSVKVGGPYVFVDTWSNANQSNPSQVKEPYGIFDQRPLDVFQYWLQHKVGAGFITFDASLENRDTTKILHQQPFVAAHLFADVVTWLRSLNPSLYPGSTTLPINLSEWFAWTEIDGTSTAEDNALKAYTMMQFIAAGGSIALTWSAFGNGASDYGLWSPTQQYGGGQPYPWYSTYKQLGEDFGNGKKLYKTHVSDPLEVGALASNSTLMLVNETDHTVVVTANGSTFTLAPYQVSFTPLT